MADTIVYDDACGLCTRLAEAHTERTEAEAVGFSELKKDERERLPEDYEECVHLVRGESVYSCGRAVEEALVAGGWWPVGAFVSIVQYIPGWAGIREVGYRWVADNRSTLGRFVGASCGD